MADLKMLLGGLCFPEGPRWHDGKLFFSDMHAHRVISVTLEGKAENIVDVPNWPSGLGWLPDGTMLVVSMTDRRLMRLDRDGLKLVADISKLASFYCNDMVVDSKGRSYIGNFGYDLIAGAPSKPAEIVMVTPEGQARVVADQLAFPNGTVITPDGKTLIVGESFGHQMTAYDVAADGSLSNRRVWAKLGESVPDGCCLDAEGAIWVATPMTNEVLRVKQGGEITHRVKTDQMAIACMLGGADRRTLFVLTSPSIDPAKCVALKAARIETMPVQVAGAGLP
ncbi:MAG TPA: SMP-30/gluconolactonase/LRE family protein [Candidatus Binataceae bacterium]|nr:SMP-30/gluconolactonase/LRE family protein [Candidatus Binataceae bacterium]